jgi:RNA polymerase sigma-70 factor (ECF subfamily)
MRMVPSDATLVRRVRDGDTVAFRLLVDRHHDDALRYATHLLGDPADAEDAVQETFVLAYRDLGHYREQDRFRGWLWRILINRCRTLASERARRPQPQARDVLAQQADPASPDLDLDRRLLRAELASALQALPTERREAVLLHFADGLSYPQMAAATGAGVSALKMRVHRACERLRDLLTSRPNSATSTTLENDQTSKDHVHA